MRRRITVMDCDNPACNKVNIPHEKDDPAFGYHISGGFYALGWGGGPVPAFFACSIECISPAAEAVIAKDRENH